MFIVTQLFYTTCEGQLNLTIVIYFYMMSISFTQTGTHSQFVSIEFDQYYFITAATAKINLQNVTAHKIIMSFPIVMLMV